MKEKFYLTTAIPYCSGKPHIGNTYEVILTDAIARYKRQMGYDVFFLTGTDEHGIKIETKAKELGITPKQFVDGVYEKVRSIWSLVGASYDKFIRTTDEYHEKAVAAIFKKLYEQGDIYKGVYEGWYCVPDEASFTDTQVTGGLCPDCGRPLQRVREDAYFFRMSKYADRLMKHIEENPGFVEPQSRLKEMVNNFLRPGLQDLCVTRSSFTWGIPVDFDPKHVVYVWVDALSNYITSLGYPEEDTLMKKYWPADLHLVGKEIVRFHVIIWPCMLMALDLPLPKQVFGHGWLKLDGGKISKSLGNYKDPREYIHAYGVDAVRYYALREVPFGSDGNFSEEALISRTNTDLANTLGNLVNRTISMAHKYFDGIVTNPKVEEEIDKELKNKVIALKDVVDEKMNELKVNEAIEEIMEVLRSCNKYIDETTPWTLAKDESKKERLATVLYNLLESIRICAILLSPFIPDTSNKILEQLNTKEMSYESIEFGLLEENLKLNEPKILFNRIEIK